MNEAVNTTSTTMVQQVIPEGYMKDAKGRLVPISTIDEIDLTRHDLVGELITKAQALQQNMRDFKFAAMGDIGAFVDLSLEKYGVSLGGKKGNVSLVSFCGCYKVQRSIQESLKFDERLQAAKVLIDGCLHRWSEGSSDELKTIVNDAFQVDKEGEISTGRVLALRRHKIDDPKWRDAMEAIADSIQITGSQTYVRFYHRKEADKPWQAIALDMAKL